ncbi:flagellar hook-basal body complex protein [Neobacillus ginsengisoli]|uniref:Flagellar hook protein FlgE n=1 Tax=Neobacillus ginsengisoli TaxID=904295 RepID=A0ABT9XVR5_9BACI|nr:flagellar hook-basal body complex protein [Neobacillus ginsengisoli]MDQ0199586.1 flagellar hook protein FlgE [Neobacillus ginsengisoli]
MLKSLYSGVSGMKGFQTKLDVIGNNIANVNTVGFKKSRVMFQDIINQNISGATAPTSISGGVNSKQIGLGSKVASIDTIHTPGSPMTTNVGTDLAIDGDAFFVVTPQTGGGVSYLTRAGNFTLDANGSLVNSNGYYVAGVAVDNNGVQHQIPITISDDQKSNQKFTSYSIDSNGYINVVREDGKSGKLAMDLTTNQYYLNNSTTANQNENISLATSVVPNPGGLKKVGNTLFEETGNSGLANTGRILDNKGGQIDTGVLEMSNVDLTDEFTEMIVAQRGFQANAKTITTSDSILDEIVNLKR